MGRLIDEDVLIKHLTDWRLQECPVGICDEETETYKTICECIEAVKEQPTAFDIEKVMAQLENKMCELLHMDNETFRKYEENKHIIKLTLHEVESIVRAGGKLN